MADEQLRIGDAEREQVAAALGEHYAQGRLTSDEHAERLDQIWTARTRADLQPVFRDLPDPARRTTNAAATGQSWPAPRHHLGGPPRFLFVVIAALVVLTVLTHVPFVLFGLMVALLVFSRRRRGFPGPRRMQHWSR